MVLGGSILILSWIAPFTRRNPERLGYQESFPHVLPTGVGATVGATKQAQGHIRDRALHAPDRCRP